VPDPVTAFTSPPLDQVLLENIGYARYTTPTPVQKYSIPIIAAGRDLLACAQVIISSPGFLSIAHTSFSLDGFRENRRILIPHLVCIVLKGS
jgi:hypothetical protein